MIKRKKNKNYLSQGRTNKNFSKLVLDKKSEVFSNKEVNSILPITFRVFNTKNSLEKQKFALDSRFKELNIDKEILKNQKRVLVIGYLLKGKYLKLDMEIKEYLKNKYSFPYIFDESELI